MKPDFYLLNSKKCKYLKKSSNERWSPVSLQVKEGRCFSDIKMWKEKMEKILH